MAEECGVIKNDGEPCEFEAKYSDGRCGHHTDIGEGSPKTTYGTIKVPRDEYKKHNDKRLEMGLTWEAYIDGESPEREDMEQLVTELQDAIEVSVDPTIELDDTDIASIQSDVEQLKELVERVPDSTVEKMEGRLR